MFSVAGGVMSTNGRWSMAVSELDKGNFSQLERKLGWPEEFDLLDLFSSRVMTMIMLLDC